MADGIAKGIGEQLGQLGKQIATDIAKVPAQIVGLDKSGGNTNEGGSGGNPASQKSGGQGQTPSSSGIDRITELKQQDEREKQQALAQARRLLQQINQPGGQPAPTIQETLEMEKMEDRKKEIEDEKKKAKPLQQATSKRPRGDLYGKKSKQFGGELGKNVKSG